MVSRPRHPRRPDLQGELFRCVCGSQHQGDDADVMLDFFFTELDLESEWNDYHGPRESKQREEKR